MPGCPSIPRSSWTPVSGGEIGQADRFDGDTDTSVHKKPVAVASQLHVNKCQVLNAVEATKVTQPFSAQDDPQSRFPMRVDLWAKIDHPHLPMRLLPGRGSPVG